MTQNSTIMNPNKLSFHRVVGLIDQKHVSRVCNNKGFTLVELIMVVALIGILATLAIPVFNNYINRARTSRALSEVRTLGTEISGYALDHNGTNPPNLAAINRDNYRDPWKRPYVYANIAGGDPPLMGPIESLNSDFDIYSVGANGLSNKADDVLGNEDDIVRFNDGSFVGVR